MQPITRYDEFVQYQFNKLITEQQETNRLLQQLLELSKPPAKEVDPIVIKRNDNDVKHKRR
jgi:hypothetical protein